MRRYSKTSGLSKLSLISFVILFTTIGIFLTVYLYTASSTQASARVVTTVQNPQTTTTQSNYSPSFANVSPGSIVTSSSYSEGGQSTNSSAQLRAQEVSTGVIVPLFTNNSADRVTQINTLIQVKNAYPTVPMVAVYNDYGSVGLYNGSTAAQIKDMQHAGIIVLGYDPTWWATRSISIVEAGMRDSHDEYGVNGIYLDQMPNWNYNGPENQAYYNGSDGMYIPGYFSTLANYARSLGMNLVVANAGTDVPQNFLGCVNSIGTFENKFLPSLNLSGGWNSITGLKAWHAKYNKSNFMFFSYDVPAINASYVLAAAKYVGYMYITNGTDYTDRYSLLSPYLEQLVSILSTQNISG